jgi:hypothetical protein
MVYKIHAGRNSIWLIRRYVLAFCIAITILALIPNDLVCTTYNVKKVLEHKPRALRPIFLKELSPEALPPLIKLLDYERDDGDILRRQRVRNGIAAILGQHLTRLERQASKPWSQQQLSAKWALKHLRPAKEKILQTLPPAEWERARKLMVNDPDLKLR